MTRLTTQLGLVGSTYKVKGAEMPISLAVSATA